MHLESYVALLGHVGKGGRGAFESTARALAVDRSVLRRRLQTLGSWLGTPLLSGRGSTLAPTAAGTRLAERAASMIALARDLPADLAEVRPKLSIACTGTITTELLPRVLLDLERAARPVLLVVRRAGGSACERLVVERNVDLGVVRNDAPPQGFASRHLADDRLWLVLPASHVLTRSDKVPSLAQMAALPLVLFGESSRTRQRVMDRLGPRGATIRVEIDGKSAALEYVRAGLGATFLSLLPGHALKAPGVWACDVSALFGASRFYVIGRRDRWHDPVVSAVVSRLVQQAKPRATRAT